VNRRGFALLLAVAALTTLGVVTATGLALALRESALGRATMADLKARGAAESALAEASRGWSRGMTPLFPGDTLALVAVTFPGSATGRAVLRALGGPILALEATGEVAPSSGTGPARSRVELLIRVDSAGPDSLLRPRLLHRGWRLIPPK